MNSLPAVLLPGLVSVILVVTILLVAGTSPVHGFSSVSAVTNSFKPVKFYSEEECVRDQLGYLPQNYVGVSAWKKKSKDNHQQGTQIETIVDSTEASPCTIEMIPVAIQTYPLNGGAKRRQKKAKLPGNEKSVVQSPFPTLFWLTCPDIGKAVADLERRGFGRVFADELNAHPDLAHRLLSCHKEYAQLRWRSITEEDRNILTSSSAPSLKRMRNMMECSGIAGQNFTEFSFREDHDANVTATSPPSVSLSGATQMGDCDGGDIIQDETSRFSPGVSVPIIPSIKCLHAHYAHYRSTVSMESMRYINPVGELIHKQLELDFPELDL